MACSFHIYKCATEQKGEDKIKCKMIKPDSFAGYEGFTTFSCGGSSSVHGHNHNDNLATGGSFLSRSSKPETICNWKFIKIRNKQKFLQAASDKDDTEFIVIPRNENCKSDKMTIFVGVIYSYKGLLLVG